MAWQTFALDRYDVSYVALNTAGYPDIYGFVRLYWSGQARATLWYYRDGAASIPPNGAFMSGGALRYYARFKQAELSGSVDLLRNEKPVYLQWNDTTNGAFLATGSEPVGEVESPVP